MLIELGFGHRLGQSYSLVYGMEAILPIEVEIPSLQVLREVELEEVEWVQA